MCCHSHHSQKLLLSSVLGAIVWKNSKLAVQCDRETLLRVFCYWTCARNRTREREREMHHGTCSDFNQYCPNARLPRSPMGRPQFYYHQLPSANPQSSVWETRAQEKTAIVVVVAPNLIRSNSWMNRLLVVVVINNLGYSPLTNVHHQWSPGIIITIIISYSQSNSSRTQIEII